LLFIIYIVHLPIVGPRSCQVIYYFDTPALGIRHQLFDRVSLGFIFFAYKICSRDEGSAGTHGEGLTKTQRKEKPEKTDANTEQEEKI
jgi:hypothetical protein